MAQTKVRFDRAVEGATNIVDSGTEGTKVALGTTAQRGSTTGQFRFNSTTGLAEYYTGTQFKSIDSPPAISSIDITEVDSQAGGNQTVVITGSNFSSGATVTFVGNTGTNFNAATVTVDSATQITAVAPKASFLNAQEPYGVKVTNTSGLSNTLASQINVDSAPSWTTASGNLATIEDEDTGTHATVAATDADGDTVAYSLQSGSLGGLSLNSANGVISGDPTDVTNSTTLSFTLRATANSKTADRAFTIIVNPKPDGSSRGAAIVVSKTQNALTQLFAGESTSNNHSTYNSPVVRWFKTTNTADETYVFPTLVANTSSNTWLMIQKNFVPHAYKSADSDSNTAGGTATDNNSAHELSYGLINSSGGALITTANVLGNAANQSPTLGTHHARVGAKSFGDNTFTSVMMYSRGGQANILNNGGNYNFDPIAKLHLGQNPANSLYENNTWYNTDSGSYYMYFNTRMDANDMDFMRNGLTPYNNVQHDRYNSPAEHEGTSWFRDGNVSGHGNYTGENRDPHLEGNQAYGSDAASSAYGQISIWVK
jgi:hypothetical protein